MNKIQNNKFKKETKKCLIDCVSNKKYNHSCDLILKSCLFERKVSYQRAGVIQLNLSIENLLNVSRPGKFIFENLHIFFLFFVATRS